MSAVNEIEKNSPPNPQVSLGLFELGLSEPLKGWLLEMLRLNAIETIYAKTLATVALKKEANANWSDNEALAWFCLSALAELEVPFNLPIAELTRLREIKGPLIFVANHPFGAVDALFLIYLMTQVRPDFKFLANDSLAIIPAFQSILCGVQITNKSSQAKKKRQQNFLALRHLVTSLKQGGAVGLFPAGEVALFSERNWHSHLGTLVKLSQATVIPIYFEGKNSLFFRIVGSILPPLQLPLLVRELLHYKRPLRYQIRPAIETHDLGHMNDPAEVSRFIFERTLRGT